MQAVILCGGKGTRLNGCLPPGQPKAMADVCGKPFLQYLLSYWEPYVERFILATGYGHDWVCDYFGKSFEAAEILYSPTTQGTDYAVADAMKLATSAEVLVLNGDTYTQIDPIEFSNFHKGANERMTLAYSAAAGRHAGVDIIDNTFAPIRRAAIYTYDEFFIDIGTPDKLEEFREIMREIMRL